MVGLRKAALAAVLALGLSACAGADINMRGWQVKAFASLPLQTPLIEQNYERRVERAPEPMVVPVVRDRWHTVTRDRWRTRTVTRRNQCTPPRSLMHPSPYLWGSNYVRKLRELQRWVRTNCQ